MGPDRARPVAIRADAGAVDPALVARARVAAVAGLLVLAIVGVSVVLWAEPFSWATAGTGHDARPYWEASLRAPYVRGVVGAHDAYLYSPAFLQLIGPLRDLPWTAFLAAWQLILLVATALLSGPVLLAPVGLLAAPELWGGNITLLLALAVVAGFRWPAAWAFVLLTKVTPGVGVLWFAVRREWQSLAIAVGATLAVVALSTIVAPGIWRQWIDLLVANVGQPITSGSIPIPLVARLPVAVVLLVWGALGGRRWVVPVACLLALPVVWYGSLTLLLGVIPLVLPDLARRWPILGVGWRDLLGMHGHVPVGSRTGQGA